MLELSLVNRTWDNSQADGCWLWMGGKSLAVQCRRAIMYIVYIIVCTVNMEIYIYIYCIYYLFLYCIWKYLIYVPTFTEVDNGTVNCSSGASIRPAGPTPGIERMDTRNHGFAKGISFFLQSLASFWVNLSYLKLMHMIPGKSPSKWVTGVISPWL